MVFPMPYNNINYSICHISSNLHYSKIKLVKRDATDITWEDARETCIGLSDSGWTVDLASLDSTAQLEAFAEAWATVGADYRPYGYMWVGFTRETGEWANLDGVPISLYSNVWREGHPHDMNMYVYIEDVTMTSGSESRGRFYASCTMTDALQRALCRAYPQK